MSDQRDLRSRDEISRPDGQRPASTPGPPPDVSGGGDRADAAYALAGLVVLMTICFAPLLRYFFAQDDFYLLYRATYETREMLWETFGANPHHFRPLTKTVYFNAAYRIFGLNALPYHIVSLAVHVGNSMLVYSLLRRFRLSAAPAVVATGLFALNVAFFHAVGWISCIQQLAGTAFLLLAVRYSLAALERGGTRNKYLSAMFYLSALCSLEQTFLAPALVWMIAVLGLADRRYTGRQALASLWPQFLLLAVYAGARIFWKGVPDEGTSRFVFGTNIPQNLAVYVGALYDLWPQIGDLIPVKPLAPTAPWFLFAALTAYNVLRHRLRQVSFAVVFIVAALLPALFLFGHVFYYHTYAPAFGAVYLASLALEDLFALLRRVGLRSARAQIAIAAAALAVTAVVSTRSVRDNERRALDPETRLQGSFVLRRAVIAENAYRDLKTKAGDMSRVRSVEVLYGSPRTGFEGHKPRDLYWAFGRGTAFRMFFDRYTLKLTVDGPVPEPNQLLSVGNLIFAYDDYGHCYTYEEVMRAQSGRAPNRKGAL